MSQQPVGFVFTFRQNGDGGNWRNNPSPHSQDCIRNGGVQNMGFGPNQNTPAVLRVRWSPSCQIPYHYHPTGALYFIQYGKMYFEGMYLYLCIFSCLVHTLSVFPAFLKLASSISMYYTLQCFFFTF